MAGPEKSALEHIPGENVAKQSRDDLQTDFIAATSADIDYSSG